MVPILGIGTVVELEGQPFTVKRIYGKRYTNAIGQNTIRPVVVLSMPGSEDSHIDGYAVAEALGM